MSRCCCCHRQPAAALEPAALDKRLALALLGRAYSANAYPFSPRYQNCNQWVAELLATAWGPGGEAGEAAGGRERAQAWLRSEGYEATVFDVGWRALMWAGAFIPWVHGDDHPAEDVEQQIYRVSMPASIEAFVQRRVPGRDAAGVLPHRDPGRRPPRLGADRRRLPRRGAGHRDRARIGLTLRRADVRSATRPWRAARRASPAAAQPGGDRGGGWPGGLDVHRQLLGGLFAAHRPRSA